MKNQLINYRSSLEKKEGRLEKFLNSDILAASKKGLRIKFKILQFKLSVVHALIKYENIALGWLCILSLAGIFVMPYVPLPKWADIGTTIITYLVIFVSHCLTHGLGKQGFKGRKNFHLFALIMAAVWILIFFAIPSLRSTREECAGMIPSGICLIINLFSYGFKYLDWED